MNEIKRKYLRPGCRRTDQFIIAALLTTLLEFAGAFLIPRGLLVGPFAKMLGGDHDAAVFLLEYFGFLGLWIVFFLAVIIFAAVRFGLTVIKVISVAIKAAVVS